MCNDNTFKCGESICAVVQKRKAWDYSLMRLLPLLPLPSVVGDSLADKTEENLCTMKMQKVRNDKRWFSPQWSTLLRSFDGSMSMRVSASDFIRLFDGVGQKFSPSRHDWPSEHLDVPRGQRVETAHDDEVQSSKGEKIGLNANDRSLDYAHSTETSTWIAFVWKTSHGRIEIDQKRKENGWQFQWVNAARIH